MCTKQDNNGILSPILLLSTVKHCRYYIWDKHKKTLKVEGKENRWIRDLRIQIITQWWSLHFLFASYTLDLELKSQQPRNANAHRQRKPQQKPAFSPKEQEIGRWVKQKLLNSNCSTPMKYCRKKTCCFILTYAKEGRAEERA